MNTKILILILAVFFSPLLFSIQAVQAGQKPIISNITVIGFVFCDACSNNTFSKHSYFLNGAKVQVTCKFKVSSSSTEEISIDAERTTDKHGFYKLDVPPVDGFECTEGHEIQSFCRASLVKSSSSLCSVPGLRSSTGHVAIKSRDTNICFFNLNALNYRPAKIDSTHCGTKRVVVEPSAALNSSLFFWPPFLPFGLPWPPQLPPLPFPFPPSWPFPLPSWFPFPKPSSPFSFLPPISSFFPPFYSPPSQEKQSPPSSWYPFLPPSPPYQVGKQNP